MRKEVTKTGIVIVSYNASEAVRITLASVRRAYADAAFKLILIDNASEPSEREKIRAAMSMHIAEVGPSWRYIEQDKNLGFSGGNNIGISEFFADKEITHICLLNSDVVVTDHWLDRLLSPSVDIISAVTNKADSEQCVPIDYQVKLEECLDERSDKINDKVYLRIADFADRWNTAWKGNLIETDVTFFCVLLTRSACQHIGLLDETFFPGGFEDDDYCLRARDAGYNIHLARDAFIHHWGSASFGQLQYEYFTGRAQRNKEYLEKKHGIAWRRRPEKTIVSFAMDIDFALKHSDRFSIQSPFLELYTKDLAKQIDYYELEFRNLRGMLAASERAVSETLENQVATAEAYGDLNALWSSVVERAMSIPTLKSDGSIDSFSVSADLERIAAGVNERVECNFAIHAFITSSDQPGEELSPEVPLPASSVSAFAPRPTTRLGKSLWILSRGLEFILRFDGIVFFGGYFYPERQSDGYFQRIQIIDNLFTDRWRVYVESDELPGRKVWFDRPEPKVLVLRIIGSKKRRLLVRLLALLAVLRSRKIYFHSVLRMHDNRFGRLLHLPFIRKAVDIHGVVPEEFRMHNDFFSAVLYEKEEACAVKKAGIVIVVTDAMRQYLQQKFQTTLKARTASFPMFPSFTPMLATRPLVDGKPVIVYAGGLHKWQQVPKMIDAIARTVDSCSHRFYCPQPQVVKDMLPPELSGMLEVESKTHAELMILYPQCHYGFILREDIIVNRVACPTKLVEYLTMGIVPIVDCEDIGDFKSLGMRFIRLDDFLAGRLPAEEQRVEMATANFAVYEHLKEVQEAGVKTIQSFFSPKKRDAISSDSAMGIVRRLLPPDTLAGRAARRVWRAVTLPPNLPGASASVIQEDVSIPVAQERLPECDILVQVDNFEAGGLENVVIDLNSTLMKAGYRVVLLVLGNQGPSVKRARDMGQTVICHTYALDSHVELIDKLQPKVVLAHYSFRGADTYNQKAIPFVQVIHNIYMWFNDFQRQEFKESAALTTAFVAVSEYVRNYSVLRLGVPAEKSIVITNGIDFEPFVSHDSSYIRRNLRVQYDIADEDFVFLDVGAINHQKNHLGTIKAFEITARTCPRSRLLVLGPSYEAGLLKEMLDYIEENGLQEKVIYCGSAPTAYEYMAMADAFVTGTFFEGGPLTLFEAIRANLPTVVSNVGCASHFTHHKGIELVDPVYDMTQYNGAIWEMKSNSEFEERLAKAMVRTYQSPVRPDFSVQELAVLEKGYAYEQYQGLVANLIAGKGVNTAEMHACQIS